MISHALPFSSPAQLTMCPPANHAPGEEKEGGGGGGGEEARVEEEGIKDKNI